MVLNDEFFFCGTDSHACTSTPQKIVTSLLSSLALLSLLSPRARSCVLRLWPFGFALTLNEECLVLVAKATKPRPRDDQALPFTISASSARILAPRVHTYPTFPEGVKIQTAATPMASNAKEGE